MNDAFTPRIIDHPEERAELEAKRRARIDEDEVIDRFDHNPRYLAREFLNNEEEIRRLNRLLKGQKND